MDEKKAVPKDRFGNLPLTFCFLFRLLVLFRLLGLFFVVIVLANQMQVDLQTAMELTLEKYRVRDADRWERKESPTEQPER